MEYIGCAIKALPPDKLLASAEKAVEVNPANSPRTAGLGLDFTPSPERLAVMTQKTGGLPVSGSPSGFSTTRRAICGPGSSPT
jgi:hypothetical protein